MKNYDLKHIAFHVLVILYFVWFVVYSVLIGMGLLNVYNIKNDSLENVLLLMILFKFISGSLLFLIISYFKSKTTLTKVIRCSYILISIISCCYLIIEFIK